MKSSKARAFATPARLRRWLETHRDEAELLLRCWKTGASQRGVTYRQALEDRKSVV